MSLLPNVTYLPPAVSIDNTPTLQIVHQGTQGTVFFLLTDSKVSGKLLERHSPGVSREEGKTTLSECCDEGFPPSTIQNEIR
jgi:hypothetical protein